jgi:cupin 2 domain-containing protein
VEAGHLQADLPPSVAAERFDDLVRSPSVRIERIVSQGQCSPLTGWYDQDEHEWVMVVQGSATLVFEDGTSLALSAGSHVNIPAHIKHRVAWTDPDQLTVWLAVFYR